jgi:hypothetical protein
MVVGTVDQEKYFEIRKGESVEWVGLEILWEANERAAIGAELPHP